MKGVILHLYRNQERGMIRGDDGEQVPFRKSALSGVEFRALSAGQRVSYQIREDWLGKEAVEVRPMLAAKAPENVWNQGGELTFGNYDWSGFVPSERTIWLRINEDLSGGRKKLGAAMKVRELVAMLAKADPDDIVAIDADAKCLLLLNQRPGMFQPLDENEACAATLTECDRNSSVLCVCSVSVYGC